MWPGMVKQCFQGSGLFSVFSYYSDNGLMAFSLEWSLAVLTTLISVNISIYGIYTVWSVLDSDYYTGCGEANEACLYKCVVEGMKGVGWAALLVHRGGTAVLPR
jgi:hypothetical protein